jgi:outer membrane receptor protein involved in Fe transport
MKYFGGNMKVFLYTMISALFYFTSLNYAAEENGVIEGQIIDKNTKQVIVGATVEVMETQTIALSDTNGNFKITGLYPRYYNLKIWASYYVGIYKNDIPVSGIQSTKLIIELKLASYQTDEVVVSAARLFEKSGDLAVSTNSLSPEEIRSAPGAVEDLNRMIQTLPGVTTATDARNDLIVRGGSPVENFIMVDGIEVPNINHFGTQGASGGPIGMINVDFLNDVTFSAGGFPAKYGDRLSSIMDIQYREGDKHNLTGKFDLGIAGAGLVLEGPIQKEKSSFLFSARKSYLDLILSSTNLTAVPNYTNFNLKATYQLSGKHKLEIIGMGGIDKININGFDTGDEPTLQDVKYSGWQSIAGLADNWLAADNLFIRTSFSNNAYERDIDVDSLGNMITRNKSLDQEYIFRSDISFRISSTDLLETGLNVKYLNNNNDFYRKSQIDRYGNFRDEFQYNSTASAWNSGAYAQLTKNLFDRLTLTGGLRYDNFSYINKKSYVSPRTSVAFSITDNLKLNAAYGIYFQAPPLIWLVADERNKELKEMRTDQYVAGFEYYPVKDIKITLEYFDKQYRDYPNSVIDPQITYANAGADYGTTGLEYLIAGSKGYARGIELFVQKKLTDNLYGMFDYSYSKIRFTSLDGIERPSSFDYKNVFTLILGYKFNANLELSGKWRYMGGRPYTPFDINLSQNLNQSVYDYNRYNAERFSSYQRLDIRVDYRVQFSNWAVVSFLDFQNILNKKNIEQLIWNQKKDIPDKILQWKFLPAGGVKIEF